MEVDAPCHTKYSGPLIWQTASAESMNASVGDFVTPGDVIENSNVEYGSGEKNTEKGAIA